jgi:hypothetical protein
LEDIQRYEDEWEVFANRLADRIDMIHEEVIGKPPSAQLEAEFSSLPE